MAEFDPTRPPRGDDSGRNARLCGIVGCVEPSSATNL